MGRRPSWSSTGPLQARGRGVLPGRGGPCAGRRTLRRASRSAGTQGPGRPWCLVRPAAASGSRAGLRRPQALPGPPLPHGSCSSSFHRTLFLLLLESLNFENMSFCQIRRDSLWSFLRSVRTQSQPLVAGPRRWQALPGTHRSGLGSALPPPRATPVQRPSSSHA